MNIDINHGKCTKCGRCVRVCPAKVFVQATTKAEIIVDKPNSCIICGHCVDACADTAVIHQQFTFEKIHTIDYNKMPSPEQVLLLCKARRSNRAFTKSAVSDKNFDLIIEAAHTAPTGGNTQSVEFTLITDPVKLKAIIGYAMGIFSKNLKKLKNPILSPILKRLMPDTLMYIPIFERLEYEYGKGNDPILRGATAVLFIHTPKTSHMGDTDSNLAYQNGSLMAESLGVSQLYTGFVLNALKQDKKRGLEKLLNIEGTIHAGMALGMPAFKFPNYVDRKDLVVKKY